MADDVKAIQIEIRWQRVVKEESQRKNSAYPWNLDLSPPKDKPGRATNTKRSESTEAESARSESPEHTLGVGKPGIRERRLPSLPRPKSRVEIKRDDKENVRPVIEGSECRKSVGQPPLLTFRKHESLHSLSITPIPTCAQMPLKSVSSSSYDHLLGLSADDQFSDMEELASTSGFLPKCYPEQSLETVYSPEQSVPEDEEISLTLDHFLDGVNRLKGDLRALQLAASADRSSRQVL